MQDRDAAGRVDRVVEPVDDVAVDRVGVEFAQVLGERLAGDGERVAVQQALVEHGLHDDRDAAVTVDVVHDVLAERLHVGDVRRLVADAVEVVQRQVDLRLAGDRQQVQHDVRRAAERHREGDRVLERLLGQDVAGRDAQAQQVDDGLARAVGVVVAAAVGGGGGGGAREAQSERLGDRRHRVGGVHAAAGALAGGEGALDALEVGLGHPARHARADALERVDDRDVLLGAVAELHPAGRDRSGVEEDARQIEPRAGHQHPGDRLVAAGEQDRAVEALGHHDGLDRVGDDLARDEREVHALVAHRDAVGDGDGAELQRVSPTGVHALLGPCARRSRLRLQGVISFQLDAMPIWGLSSPHPPCPTARSIPRDVVGLDAVGDDAAAGFDVDGVIETRHPPVLSAGSARIRASRPKAAANCGCFHTHRCRGLALADAHAEVVRTEAGEGVLVRDVIAGEQHGRRSESLAEGGDRRVLALVSERVLDDVVAGPTTPVRCALGDEPVGRIPSLLGVFGTGDSGVDAEAEGFGLKHTPSNSES